MARITFRFPSKTTGSALTSSHRRLSFPSTEMAASVSTSWTGCPVRKHRLEGVADGASATMVRRPAPFGSGDRMDAADDVAGLTVAAGRKTSSDPSRERVVDPFDDAMLVDQEDADVGDVEDGLKLGVGGLQLTGALLEPTPPSDADISPVPPRPALRSVTSMPISRIRWRAVGVGKGEVGNARSCGRPDRPIPSDAALGFSGP